MQSQSFSDGTNEDEIRLLNGKAVLSHYRHIRSQPGRKDKRCSFCRDGLGAVITIIEREEPEPVVDKGGGTDEEEDATSAPARWRIREEEG